MTFSTRTSQHDVENALAVAVASVRATALAGGPPLLDLTVGNPTTAAIPYDDDAILAALSDRRALAYAPEPLGLPSARDAVARDYQAHGASVDVTRIAITASTSEAYAVLFKILCDPDDEVLVPSPSYPLLAFLAAFESVRLVPYPLVYAGGWHVDIDGLRAAASPRARAIVVVNPNNPTGSYLAKHELDAMLDLDLPIIADEVFARFPLGSSVPDGRLSTVLGTKRGLVFALSGLSKLAALPQMKLGWIAVDGDETLASTAMRRLELVLDAYLSVGAPVQHALAAILASRERATQAIALRTRDNLATLHEVFAQVPSATVLPVEGGWYATLRVPETLSDEQWALDLVLRDGVYVHPGYFFDMTRGAHLVLSLLCPEALFAEGARRIASRVAATLAEEP